MATVSSVPLRNPFGAHSGQLIWSEHDGHAFTQPVFYCYDERARLRWRIKPHHRYPNGWELDPNMPRWIREMRA